MGYEVTPRASHFGLDRCLACGAPGSVLYHHAADFFFGSKGTWTVVRCTDPRCALIWLSPQPTVAALAAAYSRYYTHDVQQRISSSVTTWARRCRRFLSSVSGRSELRMRRDHMFLLGRPPGTLLDVGCGNGTNLDRFRKLGWTVFGQEIDPKAAATAATRSFPVFVGPLSALASGCRFDAIIMNHVIEHVRDPLSLLADCRRLLKPSGILVIATPNAAGLGAKMFGRYWRGYEVPRHLFVFTPASLSTILKRSGLQCINRRTMALSAQSIFLESLAAAQATYTGRGKSFLPSGLFTRALSLLYCAVAEVAMRVSWIAGDEILMICKSPESE